jgi:hypothetical protein
MMPLDCDTNKVIPCINRRRLPFLSIVVVVVETTVTSDQLAESIPRGL